MTLNEVYSILESNQFYETESMTKYRFTDNAIRIDRRAIIPFSIFKEDEKFFLDPDTAIAIEKQLRIEIEQTDSKLIHFYGKTSGEKLLTLNEEH